MGGNGLDQEAMQLLAHQLRNTLFAIDMLLERALDHEKLGTNPLDDVQRARDGVAETLEIVKNQLE
jgi:hypothetical protein